MTGNEQDTFLENWLEGEALAESALHIIGKLHRDQGVVTLIHGRPVINFSTIDLIKAHRFVWQIENQELFLKDSFPILEAIGNLKLPAVRIDLGILTRTFLNGDKTQNPAEYVNEQLKEIVDKDDPVPDRPQDVVLYGFGRVGRLLARLLVEQTG